MNPNGEIVADDLLGRAATITYTPRADLFNPTHAHPGARLRFTIDNDGYLSVQTAGFELKAGVQLAPGTYHLVCDYYDRAFHLSYNDPCILKDRALNAWRATSHTDVAATSNAVAIEVQ